MKSIFGFPVVSGGSELNELGRKISTIKFTDWRRWAGDYEECLTCKKTDHIGIWNGERFMVCPMCNGRGFLE